MRRLTVAHRLAFDSDLSGPDSEAMPPTPAGRLSGIEGRPASYLTPARLAGCLGVWPTPSPWR
jgi:hypothetical protein